MPLGCVEGVEEVGESNDVEHHNAPDHCCLAGHVHGRVRHKALRFLHACGSAQAAHVSSSCHATDACRAASLALWRTQHANTGERGVAGREEAGWNPKHLSAHARAQTLQCHGCPARPPPSPCSSCQVPDSAHQQSLHISTGSFWGAQKLDGGRALLCHATAQAHLLWGVGQVESSNSASTSSATVMFWLLCRAWASLAASWCLHCTQAQCIRLDAAFFPDIGQILVIRNLSEAGETDSPGRYRGRLPRIGRPGRNSNAEETLCIGHLACCLAPAWQN